MPIVVVGGSAKDIGKTALVCAVISGLSEFGWTAVKITGHEYEIDSISKGPTIRSELTAGETTDTARYLAAGARRALLVTRCGPEIPIDEIRAALKDDRNILFESNRIMDAVTPDACLALVGGQRSDWKPSFLRLLSKVDALVSLGAVEMESAQLAAGVLRFELPSLDRLTPKLVTWLRSRLSTSRGQVSKA